MSDALLPPPLRPQFTRELANRLLHGGSINLTAAHGLGRRRTVADLRTILPQDLRLLYADMKFCLDEFPALLADLYAQAGLAESGASHLGQLIEILALSSQASLLILHNFDLLRPDQHDQPHDPLFDTALLPHLAGFRDHKRLALLVICEDIHPDWPLPCEHLALPPLQHP